MSAPRVLVTGAAGFVGANLVRTLVERPESVHGIVRPETDGWRLEGLPTRFHLHRIDLTNAADVGHVVRSVRPDIIVHLAKHRGDPHTLDYRGAYATNVHATLNLLEAAAQLSNLRRFVHAGSSLEYDLERSPLREDDPSTPVTVHGVTKAAATALCLHFARRHRVPVVVLRLFTVYGPWEDPGRFVPRLLRSVLGGPPLRLTREGLRHDWIYVADVVDACCRAMDEDLVTGHVINVGTGRQSSNEELVRIVEDAAGRAVPRDAETFPDRPWDSATWVADVSKAREYLRWSATTSLRDGLARTFAWFHAHRTGGEVART